MLNKKDKETENLRKSSLLCALCVLLWNGRVL